jgi:uncharacterized protein (DUF1778 family)
MYIWFMVDKKENKTVNINIRVSEDTKKELTRLADLDRRTLSDFIRLQLERLTATLKKQ